MLYYGERNGTVLRFLHNANLIRLLSVKPINDFTSDLEGVDLRGADLRGLDLQGLNLEGAILDEVINEVLFFRSAIIFPKENMGLFTSAIHKMGVVDIWDNSILLFVL